MSTNGANELNLNGKGFSSLKSSWNFLFIEKIKVFGIIEKFNHSMNFYPFVVEATLSKNFFYHLNEQMELFRIVQRLT